MIAAKYLALATLLRNERRPASAIDALREHKLARLLRHAHERVPFYRELFDSAGVRPADIRTPADLTALPTVGKRDLIDAGDDVRDPLVPARNLVQRRTSGTSGLLFKFAVDRDFDQFCKAQFLRPYLSYGRRPFERALRFTCNPNRRPAWHQRLGLLPERLVDCSAPPDEMLAAYRGTRPDIVMGYPSSVAMLADAVGADASCTHRPRVVFTDSEPLNAHARARIRSGLTAPIIDVYGTFETDNIAWQCADGSPYHYAADCVILEVLSEGRPVQPGEPGELVCTVLNSRAMPFIRYRIGDIAALPDESCDCGNRLPLLTRLEGRVGDRLTLPDGRKVMALPLFDRINEAGDLIRESQLIQESENDFTFSVVLRVPFSETVRDRIVGILRPTHPQARVKLDIVDLIAPGPSGKKPIFVSRLT